jgi:hypothetical protein
MGNKRAYSVLVATPEGKRLSEKPRYRLKKSTKIILKKSAGHMVGSSGLGKRQLASSCEQNNETSLSVSVGHFSEDLVNSHQGLCPLQLVSILVYYDKS